MLARELIDRIERRGLLDPEIIEALREQLNESRARVTPEALAKLLVDNGQLTRFQATKLIGELRAGENEEAEVIEAGVVEDDLGLADGVEVVEVEAIEDDGPAAALLLDDDGGVVDAEVMDAEVVDAVAVEDEIVDAVPVAETVDESMEGASLDRPKPTRPKKPQKLSNKSQWDSFKIYGYGTILVLLTFLFMLLYWWFNQGNEDQHLKIAEKLYNELNFEGAKGSYKAYLNDFSDGKSASLARVRIVMSDLNLERMNNGSDATKPHAMAKKVLPTIEEEPGLEVERDNLASFLLEVGEKIVQQADLSKSSAQKRTFIEVFDEHQKLLDNATFFPTSIKLSLEKRLEALAEDRNRVMRDVMRDEALAAALETIGKALESKDTKTAFSTRRELVRAYPQLYDQSDLVQLVQKASKIQQELVKTGQPAPQILEEELKTSVLRSIALANRTGNPISELTGQVYYARSQGSVLALAAEDGHILWRQFVGYRDRHAPLSLGTTPDDGVLLSDGERLEIQKLDGTTGKVVWRAVIGEAFNQPVLAKGFIYLTTETGRVICVEARTGRARWVSQLPQGILASPGVNADQGVVYVAGDHSNVYLLGATDGACLESYYSAHEPGTIVAAPTALLGHVFLYENPNADESLVHVMRVNDKALEMKAAQNDFRLTGNIRVQPEVVGRRLHILTDRGQVSVLDVDTTAENEQVSEVAAQPAASGIPLNSTMAVDKGQMWVASDRLVRYQLQINTRNVVREWVEYDGDTFMTAPRLMGPALIISRVMSGTEGIRVSAIEPKTKEELWRVDIGVPTALVTTTPNNQGLYAISGKAALYLLDRNAFESGSTAGPIENPAISGRAFRLGDPVDMGQGRFVMTNLQTPGQFVVLDPSREREKLRLVAVAIPDSNLAAPPIRVKDGLLLALDTGRLLYVNWQTGASLGSPYQAPVKPGEKYRWTHPIPVQDGSQVVLVDNYHKVRRINLSGALTEAQSAEFEREPLGGAASLGDVVFIAARSPGSDVLTLLDANSLAVRSESNVDGKILWGPRNIEGVDQLVLVLLDQGRLCAYGPKGDKLWEAKMPSERIVGQPLSVGGNVVLSGAEGWIATIDPASGKIIGSGDLEQPVSTTPLPVGPRLFVPGMEGDVFAAEVPHAP